MITGVFRLGNKTPVFSSMALPAPSSIPLSTKYYCQVFLLNHTFSRIAPGWIKCCWVLLEIIGAAFYRSDALSAAQPTVSEHGRELRALIRKRSWPHPNLAHQLTPRSMDAVVFTPALWRWYHSHLHATWNANSCLNSATSQSTILNYSNTTKKDCLSTFWFHVGRLHQDWLPVPVVSMQKLVSYVTQFVAPLVSIHTVGLPDPYCLPYESASFVWFSTNHLGVLPVYHMILIKNTICNCRFVFWLY